MALRFQKHWEASLYSNSPFAGGNSSRDTFPSIQVPTPPYQVPPLEVTVLGVGTGGHTTHVQACA